MPRVKHIARKGKKVVQEGEGSQSSCVDIASQFGAPFPIFTNEEGVRYVSLLDRSIVSCRFLNFSILDTLQIRTKIDGMLNKLGWTRFANTQFRTYRELVLEFYTTLHICDKGTTKLTCRLLGREFSIDYDVMSQAFGFPKGGLQSPPPQFRPDDMWNFLSGEDRFLGSTKTPNGLILDHSYLILHKFMCHAIFGKLEGNKVSRQELFLLWCLRANKKVSTTTFIFQNLVYVLKHPKTTLSMGHIVTGLAVHFGVFDPSRTDLTLVHIGDLSLDLLIRAEIVTDKMQLRNPSTRKCFTLRRGDRVSFPIAADNDEEDDDNNESGDAAFAQSSGQGSEVVGWQQILQRLDTIDANNRRMEDKLDVMDARLRNVEKRQVSHSYKLMKYFEHSGFHISSPPSSPP